MTTCVQAAVASQASARRIRCTWSRLAVRILRLEARAGTPVTLVRGMSISSAGVLLITTAMPDRPQSRSPFSPAAGSAASGQGSRGE